MGDEANAAKAEEYLREAESKLQGSKGFFSKMFGNHSKIEEACDLYGRAGNAFKMAKKWSDAGAAFVQVAEIQLNQLESKHECASKYVEASNCYRKTDFEEAIVCLNNAVEQFTDMGRFSIAAKHHMTIADIYETSIMDIERAVTHYQQAADYYKGEESSSSANKALLKIAQLSAQQEDYQRAIKLYEEVAAVCVESDLLKYSAREYLFKAALCGIAQSPLDCADLIPKYVHTLPAFEDSREHKLLKELMLAIEDGDQEAFSLAVSTYDSISRLNDWYTTILLRIKKNILNEDIN